VSSKITFGEAYQKMGELVVDHDLPEREASHVLDKLLEADRLIELCDEMAGLLKAYRVGVPLGHQPSMKAHIVDEALAKYEQFIKEQE